MDNITRIEKRSAPETGVINITLLENLKKFQQTGEPDFVTELIDLFLDDTAIQLESLRVAVSKNDASEIRRLAHLVKAAVGISAPQGWQPSVMKWKSWIWTLPHTIAIPRTCYSSFRMNFDT